MIQAKFKYILVYKMTYLTSQMDSHLAKSHLNQSKLIMSLSLRILQDLPTSLMISRRANMQHLLRNLFQRGIVDNISGLKEKLMLTETLGRLQSTPIQPRISCTLKVEIKKKRHFTISNTSKLMETMLLASRGKEITIGKWTLKLINLAMEKRNFLTEQPSLFAQRELKEDSQRPLL